jgi:hypothetical protein
MVLASFCVNLASQQLIEKVGVGGFLFCRLFQASGQLLFDLVEPQLMGSVRAGRSSCGVLIALRPVIIRCCCSIVKAIVWPPPSCARAMRTAQSVGRNCCFPRLSLLAAGNELEVQS